MKSFLLACQYAVVIKRPLKLLWARLITLVVYSKTHQSIIGMISTIKMCYHYVPLTSSDYISEVDSVKWYSNFVIAYNKTSHANPDSACGLNLCSLLWGETASHIGLQLLHRWSLVSPLTSIKLLILSWPLGLYEYKSKKILNIDIFRMENNK